MGQPRFITMFLRADAYVPATTGARVAASSAVANPLLSRGTKAFAGTVQVGTTPVAGRTVRLYDRASGQLLRETASDGAGLYGFPSLTDRRAYYVVALDNQPGGQNAAIADDVRPV